ncbi:MAG: DNA/RNA endonuclease G [uncultured Sulfurovum sp.]|uniref:Endonuclease n=1 Tax=uncultured Sulfurovum sp. TaxID=269237 RepID=A0A6S6U1C1_9BACT|nr:MAG: DNA/RNA endonuclease G [uncultured Sulfurovum sp.]
MRNKIFLLIVPFVFIACGGGGGTANSFLGQELTYKEKFVDENNCSQIIDNEFIVMCYDYQKKAVKSVSYTLLGDLMNEQNIEKRPSFYVEKELESKNRVSTTDYINSGYDRGHMAPDASFDWSQESLDAVYTLANIIPQAPQVNRNSWAKLEGYVRDKAEELGELNVVNVVKYGQRSSRMGTNKMAISKGYYKILYNYEENYEECFYYSNKLGVSAQNDVLETHAVSCQSVTN